MCLKKVVIEIDSEVVYNELTPRQQTRNWRLVPTSRDIEAMKHCFENLSFMKISKKSQ